MKSIAAIGLFLILALHVQAQVIEEEAPIPELMAEFIRYNQENTEIRGWRIQVLSTTDRRTMESTQASFKRKYPEYKLIFEHQNPFYNLKTGAFLTQQDARPLLRKLQEEFPGAFVVTDKFQIAEVLEYQQ